MTPPPSSALALGLEAAACTVRDPVTVLVLFAVHLLFVAGLWAALSYTMGAALSGGPEPSLFNGLATVLAHPARLPRLLLAAAMVGGLYLLGGAFLAGALLGRLQQRAVPSSGPLPGALRCGLRHLISMLLLRVGVGGLVALLAAGAAASLPWAFQHTLDIADERWHALLLFGAALPVLLAALVAALLLHYGQPLLCLGCRLRAVVNETLALVHRRPLGTAGLYLAGWSIWTAITLLQRAGLPGLVAALLRVAVHVWSYAAALRAAQVWAPLRYR